VLSSDLDSGLEVLSSYLDSGPEMLSSDLDSGPEVRSSGLNSGPEAQSADLDSGFEVLSSYLDSGPKCCLLTLTQALKCVFHVTVVTSQERCVNMVFRGNTLSLALKTMFTQRSCDATTVT